MFPVKQIFHEMSAEKLRLSLTILAIVWSTVCISTMLAAGEGLRQGLIRSSTSGNGNLIYVSTGVASINYGNFYKGKSLDLATEDQKLIKALPTVKMVSATATWEESAHYKDRQAFMFPLAVENNYKKLNDLTLTAGSRWFNPLDTKEQRKVAILGKTTAALLFNKAAFSWDKDVKLDSDPVGKQFKIGDEDFTVIGVLKDDRNIESGSSSEYSILVPLATWQRFYPNSPIQGINVEPQPNANREQLAKTIRQVIARKYNADIADEQLIQTDDMLLQQETMRSFLLGLQSFLGIIGFVTLGVAGIGIANVMYASVKRATRDIGVRMAVGATPSHIRLHYIVQAMMTMAMGGFIGLLMTLGLVSIIDAIPISDSGFYARLGSPKPELSLSVMLIVISALILVGILAAWFPANKAASITPLEALQSE
ncbi:ABC transporter permease [Photobacterium angustum]|uniref:ABC transporter permease n=1 Tax=Photobacterium angustum TaxID=661 RepID=A0A855SJG5_PHOAN|nr:ABC transporter permease [Photobacterium angustum]KJF80792.1 peptide ABC transporter permease [Photobacterium damselae subsp. damselae]KJG28949.1 peptide ABC transporter permease [Photobacterium angustum]KJG38359.1 peptide ABC transporter permease [Photobacterium angustum]KJG44255.1 peptide ABC transporter permease [Photobacterium angustum]KJG48046.1 peptide ABC transporter permease [Photobacterium angustum]